MVGHLQKGTVHDETPLDTNTSRPDSHQFGPWLLLWRLRLQWEPVMDSHQRHQHLSQNRKRFNHQFKMNSHLDLFKAEVRLEKALDQVVEIRIHNMSLRRMIQHIELHTGVQVVLDQESVRELSIDPDQIATSWTYGPIRLQSFLYHNLDCHDLQAVRSDGIIRIYSKTIANGLRYERRYPLQDLVGTSDDAAANLLSLADVIKEIWSDSWKKMVAIQSLNRLVEIAQCAYSPTRKSMMKYYNSSGLSAERS